MRRLHLLPPALALAVAWVLVFPTQSRGFQVFGDTLDLNQRDFRIWNNFTDPQANDNPAPDPDFPGSLGAELALRKGVSEWGSTPHGSGRTDPTQDRIGSGSSNFDAFFSAASGGPGNKNANVISQLDGSGFVPAFTELPIRDGWRIRFYEDPWTWNDGPGSIVTGQSAMDLQGIASHEYGHALGLDHSQVPGSTMGTVTANKGVDLRSIEADDVAGVQFLYGVLAPQKPHIDGYRLLAGGHVLIEGFGFDPIDNQVWFTHAQPVTGPHGKPVRVKAVPSTQGGTRIRLLVPAAAGPGDLVVRIPGNQHAALSNVVPFDPANELLAPPLEYGPGKVTSQGKEARLAWRTLPSTSVGSFELDLSGAVPFATAILFSGPGRVDLPFQGARLLVGRPLTRELVFDTFVGDLSLTVQVPAGLVGTTRYYQCWFQDTGDAFGSGLTNGVAVTFLP